MKVFKLLLIILSLLMLSSCELFYSPSSPTIRMVTVASDYSNLPGINRLIVCPKDQDAIVDQFEYLATESGYEYEGVHITYEDSKLYSVISSSKNGIKTFQTTKNSPYSSSSEKHMKNAISNAFRYVSSQSSDDDITIFYYTGHGAKGDEFSWVENGTLFFERDSKDCILVEELFDMMSSIKGKKLIIIDACYSGAFVYDDIYYPTSAMDAYKILLETPTIKNDNLWILSSSRSTEESWTDNAIGYSKFTSLVLDFLGFDTENKAVGNPKEKKIFLSDIAAYAIENIDKEIQIPQSENTLRDLMLFSL